MSNEKLSYKMTLIGDSGVGKTSLFKKLFRDTFDHKIVSTIGIDKKPIILQLILLKEKKK